MRVRVVIADEGWILERFARELESRLDYVDVGSEPSHEANVHYYMNYSAWKSRASEYEAAWFTHIEERDKRATARFFEVAHNMDLCICHADRYAERLVADGVKDPRVIAPGVDLDEFNVKLRVGVVGRTYHTGRKGEALVEQVMDEPGIEWAFAGEGWPGPTVYVPDGELGAFYRSLDYLLVPALYEGGPMPALEAIACGTPVISGDVGIMNKLPHIEFPTGDVEGLRRVLTQLVAEKEKAREVALKYTWDSWAEQHDALFRELAGPVLVPKERRRSVPAEPRGPLRILFSLSKAEEVNVGGPSVRVRQTADALRGMGHEVELWTDDDPPKGEFDIAHAFNSWPPKETLARVMALGKLGVPVVFSPIYMDHSESEWHGYVVKRVFWLPFGPQRLPRVLQRAHLTKVAKRKAKFSFTESYNESLRQMVSMSHHIVCLSASERAGLKAVGAVDAPVSIVRNGIDTSPFLAGDSKLFASTHDLERYVLCVGRIEHRKNQAMMLMALRDLDLQVALVGKCLVPKYEAITRSVDAKNARFIGTLDPVSPMLASAYAGAAAFVLPSWREGAPISALEAGAAGCPLVLSDRSGEREYFGDLAEYCDPADPRSIRDATLRALDTDTIERRDQLSTLVQQKYSIGETATALVDVYSQVVAEAGSGERILCAADSEMNLSS